MARAFVKGRRLVDSAYPVRHPVRFLKERWMGGVPSSFVLLCLCFSSVYVYYSRDWGLKSTPQPTFVSFFHGRSVPTGGKQSFTFGPRGKQSFPSRNQRLTSRFATLNVGQKVPKRGSNGYESSLLQTEGATSRGRRAQQASRPRSHLGIIRI